MGKASVVRAAPGSRAAEAKQGEGIDPLRVLVVEDDEDYRELLRLLLSKVKGRRPLEGVFRSCVAEASVVVGSTPLDVILSDFHLPDGTGVDLLARARRNTPHTRRIVLTGSPDAARSHQDFHNAVERLWDKAEDPARLKERLEEIVEEASHPLVAT